ncbi:MAG TPA: metallophosphoesterase, partial [Prolixibacteraceae bacterium]|nr:metallophosphoesterase [Prolixibacteraceae bacterium]
MQLKKIILLYFLALLAAGCATYTAQYRNEDDAIKPLPEKAKESRFFLPGDAGYSSMDELSEGLQVLKALVEEESDTNDFIVYLGDNVYPSGIPEKKDENYQLARHRLDVQTDIGKNFNGKTLFIPGNHDWYADDPLKGLKRQEEIVNDALGEESFLPEHGCPLSEKDLNEDMKIIIIDTQWYLEDWDKLPEINNECEINTRERFLLEVKGELKKGADKTVLFFMHHPMFTNGIHGGRYALNKHLYPMSENKKIPLPVLGTLVAQI